MTDLGDFVVSKEKYDQTRSTLAPRSTVNYETENEYIANLFSFCFLNKILTLNLKDKWKKTTTVEEKL